MIKNILLANSSSRRRDGLNILWTELLLVGFAFKKIGRWRILNENNEWPTCPVGRWLSFGPKTNNFFNSLLFLLLLPLLWLQSFLYFWFFCNKKVETVVCYGLNEKLILTLVARVFKVKVIWLEFPEVNYFLVNRILLWLYKRLSQKAVLISFNNYQKEKLIKLGINENNIKVVLPGVRVNYRQHQDNLFDNLARADKSNFHKNYFTVGMMVDLDERQNIEPVFQAIQKALDMIPSLQMIIVGEGRERKNLTWLAKRMKLENLVWFVGEQKHLRKWLDSFDLYIVGAIYPKLNDYCLAVEAMLAGLPIVGPRDVGLDDLVYENKNGVLMEIENSEMLSLQIIKLQQDKVLRQRLGVVGREMAENKFSINIMIEKFKEVL